MSRLIISVGLSGVGKSTVIEEAIMLSEHEWNWINYGDKMFEVANDRDLAETRDDMKNIRPEKYKEIQEIAANQIREEADENNVIVDTHAAIKTPFGYVPGLPKWSIEMLNPDHLVFIWAEPSEIARRRQEDVNRDRNTESAEVLEEYQSIAREMASTGAVLTGSYLKMLENKRNQAEKTAEAMAEILNE